METPKSPHLPGSNPIRKGSVAAVPGSYDPVTAGHADLIRRAAALFDTVYVVAMENPDKTYLLTPHERLVCLQEAVGGLDNVIIEYSGGFFYQYAIARGVGFIVKGLRSAADFDYEAEIAAFNRRYMPQAETVFLLATPGLEAISSSAVRDAVARREDISKFVGKQCAQMLQSKLL